MDERGEDEEAFATRQPTALYPIGRALRATYDAENHDSLGKDLTGLMLELARVEPPATAPEAAGGAAPPISRAAAPPPIARVPAPPVARLVPAAPSGSWLRRVLERLLAPPTRH